jgi:hypothetical protein
MGPLARKVHRLHRWLGTGSFALLACWFASGAVMAVAPFPSFREEERLASAHALPAQDVAVPAEVVAAVMSGERARLANVEGHATWIFGARDARRALPLRTFDQARAERELEARFGPVAWVERLEELDQWSVPQRQLPLYRAGFANGDQAYLAARTGEIVQYTSQRERVLAWFGAIPHWVYFTSLRAQQELWRYVVLALSTLGMVATGSGLLAGLSVARRLRRTLRDPVLRWHQRLGLGFGLLAFSWLFSGALSLTPFQWSQVEPPRELLTAGVEPTAATVSAALRSCQAVLDVRELELAPLAGHTYAVCAGRDATRLIELADGSMQPSLSLAGATLEREPDTYFYPQHDHAFPPAYLRLALRDEAGTTLYVDPERARLLAHHTDRKRLERWLYHGLHSLDLPGLYDHPWLWRGVIWVAMALGFALSTLGGVMAWRRVRPRARRVRALGVPLRADRNR